MLAKKILRSYLTQAVRV